MAERSLFSSSRTRRSLRLAIFLVCLGLPLFASGVWSKLASHRIKKWPRADPLILDSELSVGESNSIGTSSSATASAGISYEYKIDGVKFMGSGIEPFTLGIKNTAASRKQHDKYPPGKKVEVVFDPHNPTIVYLETGPNIMTWLVSGLGVAFLLIAAWVWRSALVRIRSRAQVVRVNAG